MGARAESDVVLRAGGGGGRLSRQVAPGRPGRQRQRVYVHTSQVHRAMGGGVGIGMVTDT